MIKVIPSKGLAAIQLESLTGGKVCGRLNDDKPTIIEKVFSKRLAIDI